MAAELVRHLKWPCQAGPLQALKLLMDMEDVNLQDPVWRMGTLREE